MVRKEFVRAVLGAAALLCVAATAAPAQQNTYVGALSCAASNCHGGTQATAGRVDGNEHSVWLGSPHSTSYRKLTTPRAQLIARNLGLGDPTGAQLCLGCHATSTPPGAAHGENFSVTEGVTCEACHGAAGGWVDTHSAGGVALADLQASGMYATWDPVARAEMCLDCHLGSAQNFAGHRVMGAGHPRVSFELDSYTFNDSVLHHTVDDDYVERKPYVDGARSWAIGEAVMIERRIDLLLDQNVGMNGAFPEFVFFECHSCHQPMSARRRPSPGQLGTPQFDDSHLRMLRIALNATDPALAERLDDQMTSLHRAASQGRSALVSAAQALRATASQAIESISSREWGGAQISAMLRDLSSQAADGRLSDYGAAEQTVLAIGANIAALADAGVISDAEFDRLFNQLAPAFSAVERDQGYSADTFISAMKSFDAALR